MKRKHPMPFGTEMINGGGVCFRLWAPAASQVDLCLQTEEMRQQAMQHDNLLLQPQELRFAMNAQAGGWFEYTVEQACKGDYYRFFININFYVPDPVSRTNPFGVHEYSQIVDPEEFDWSDENWLGLPWHSAVFYECHVGAFTRGGSFLDVIDRLDYLARLGVTAIELMPVAATPGNRNWGYDGVLLFAPAHSYGKPEDLKLLIQTAHQKGLMVFLDVVYNHFGPEGNYLHIYAPQFFNQHEKTPWGEAINFDGIATDENHRRTVRDFFIHNAVYWLEEFHFDGLRLDAVHAIKDQSTPHILQELAEAVHERFGKTRKVHLVLENDNNEAHYLVQSAERLTKHSDVQYDGQWNDDFHHAMHVLLTHEHDRYYSDYNDKPAWYLGRCLTEGFAYQGELSAFRHHQPHGEHSKHLPLTAFINFLQNHDQIGNRLNGERLISLTQREALQAAVIILLLAPSPPLIFMGEEFASAKPFTFFCDFNAEISLTIAEERRKEHSHQQKQSATETFQDETFQDTFLDPTKIETFLAAKLDWESLSQAVHGQWLDRYRHLLALRHKFIEPLLANGDIEQKSFRLFGRTGLLVEWQFSDGSQLHLLTNLGEETVQLINIPDSLVNALSEDPIFLTKAPLYQWPEDLSLLSSNSMLLPWSVAWILNLES